MDRYPALDRTVLSELLDILKAYNPFICLYKTACERLAEPVSSQFRLLLNPQMCLIIKSGADRCQENLLTSNKVAAILTDEFNRASCCDIVFAVCNPRGREPVLARINLTHAAYMPLHYVLLFFSGDYRWHYKM
jgi:hypothetical protein